MCNRSSYVCARNVSDVCILSILMQLESLPPQWELLMESWPYSVNLSLRVCVECLLVILLRTAIYFDNLLWLCRFFLHCPVQLSLGAVLLETIWIWCLLNLLLHSLHLWKVYCLISFLIALINSVSFLGFAFCSALALFGPSNYIRHMQRNKRSQCKGLAQKSFYGNIRKNTEKRNTKKEHLGTDLLYFSYDTLHM